MKSFYSAALILGSLTYATASKDADQAVLSTDDLAHLLPLEDIPSIGFGTWNIAPKEAKKAVTAAFEAGYRHIDCAATYGNEKEVGQGIAAGVKKAQIQRHSYWVTSKLWNDAHDPEDVPKALNQTLHDLGLDYLDLYLMHWPVAINGFTETTSIDYQETWEAMAKLPKELVRNIGISNFAPAQLTSLIAAHPLSKPYLHQFEAHPYLPQEAFLATHKTLGIKMTAYSPLGNTNPTYKVAKAGTDADINTPIVEHEAVKTIAQIHNCTAAQVVLAWSLKRGFSVIPKSTNKAHIQENLATDAEKCITDEEVQQLATSLPTKRFNNPSTSWGVSLFEGLDGVTVAQVATKRGDETLVEQAEELAVEAAKWGMMEMWYGVKGAWGFAIDMIGDDGF